jgi:esterase/lipase superfamily enzyme
MRDCGQYGGNYLAIPVMWPSGEKGLVPGYTDDKNIVVPGAANAFQTMLTLARNVPFPMSLMCHSMGNYVLKLAAKKSTAAALFGDIFMVAADVRADLFDENLNSANGTDHGLAIARLLRQDGKIHVMFSTRDWAMTARLLCNWFMTALGSAGCAVETLHPSLRGKIVNKDSDSMNTRANGRMDALAHGYQFVPEAVKYYEAE